MFNPHTVKTYKSIKINLNILFLKINPIIQSITWYLCDTQLKIKVKQSFTPAHTSIKNLEKCDSFQISANTLKPIQIALLNLCDAVFVFITSNLPRTSSCCNIGEKILFQFIQRELKYRLQDLQIKFIRHTNHKVMLILQHFRVHEINPVPVI